MTTSVTESAKLVPGPRAAKRTKAKAPVQDRASFGGWILLILGLSLFASAIPSLRPRLFGLAVHPYVIVLGLASLPAFFIRHDIRMGRTLGGWGIALVVGVGLSFVVNGQLKAGLPLFVKWVTVAITFVITSRLVRNQHDFKFAIYGLVIAVSAIAIRGVLLHQLNPRFYMKLMPGIGSRNVFSLWTLAPVAFCTWMLATKEVGRRAKMFYLAGLVTMVVPQVLSLSRSGWILIVATVCVVLAMRRSFRLVIVTVVLAFAVNIGIEQFGFNEKMGVRVEALRTRTSGDQTRTMLIVSGLEVFVENPIFGVSSSKLPFIFGKKNRMQPHSSHNLMIDMLAGCGLVGTIPLLMCAFLLFRRWWTARRWGVGPSTVYLGLLPVLIILTALRGMTANAVVWNPAIIIGLAISFALANHTLSEAIRQRRALAVDANTEGPSAEPEPEENEKMSPTGRRARRDRRRPSAAT